MLSYKDRTYCTFYEGYIHKSYCIRPLTREVIEAAEQWWGNSSPPISIYLNKPSCYKEDSK